ncbi:cytochrome P450 [Streptomyces broussonetiae]|uniref:Cytochrome P450 n=2 Tax=Streptomyces broussonetiae TaxID=2686304 RepID=A0A6I6NJL1_9ACTN|nr:cytochrome P450 [Streptomyces broussonetiae]QHA08376.1 cytochrome P450 [Streptomyces broussonetiae]
METLLPRLPFPRAGVFDLPAELRELQHRDAPTKVLTPTGDEAWLVTRYADVRSLLADTRLGRTHPAPDQATRLSNSALTTAGPVGSYASEREDHARYRRRLTPAFSAKRMRALHGRTEELLAGILDRMAALPSPVDLHDTVSMPLSLHVICELLGVPYEDHDRFRAWFDGVSSMTNLERSTEARQNLSAYMYELARRKVDTPGEDLISDLVHSGTMELTPRAPGSASALDDLSYVAASLLFAGYRTTAIKVDAGAVLLLSNEDQRAALYRDPALAEGAVEEVLRLSSPDLPLLRYAREDIEIAGTHVKLGEAVLLSTLAANRDSSVFADPDRFDITRDPNPHLSFGHGPRLCIGTTLARIEIAAALRMLVQRFPSLRLALPVEDLTRRNDVLIGGLAAVPVEW